VTADPHELSVRSLLSRSSHVVVLVSYACKTHREGNHMGIAVDSSLDLVDLDVILYESINTGTGN
jgi:hypothetical protein